MNDEIKSKTVLVLNFRVKSIKMLLNQRSDSILMSVPIFLLDTAGHMTTRHGPDVARGPDVAHQNALDIFLLI